ncbi:mCG1050978 [Mus musculus]|nr:mCG1050978 [Mus musculus]
MSKASLQPQSASRHERGACCGSDVDILCSKSNLSHGPHFMAVQFLAAVLSLIKHRSRRSTRRYPCLS